MSVNSTFLEKLNEVLIERISDENFGVSKLATEIGMSRSNLLRKIKKETGQSASVYIRNVRLEVALEMLQKEDLTVSEVSFKVGFNSTSYFIKCFRELYGYPPGEIGKQEAPIHQSLPSSSERNSKWIWAVGAVMLVAVLFFVFRNWDNQATEPIEKSIAVLPFKNDSNDSTNVYLINGLMESILNNLQKIEDLRVISRTSVEKYRNNQRSIPEIAEELRVSYFVEGSGQKIGNQIRLNIQLIEAGSDKHLWSEEYTREVGDIFDLQQEVSKLIAQSVKAVITPEEKQQIEKVLSENIEAYDYYLKAMDFMNQRSGEGLLEAISLLNKAIEKDSEFAAAYANLSICYFYLDIYQTEKQYTIEISDYADKALLYDQKLAISLMAKALFYIHSGEYQLAVPYLEKALEFNPNSAPVVSMLSDFYARIQPNTSKYLQYALKGTQLDIAPDDSVAASYMYLHLSNALIQTGFVDEALAYVDKATAYFPENGYSTFVKAYMIYAKNRDIKETRDLLIKEYQKDTTRLDVLQEVAKMYYFMHDYDGAYEYYRRLIWNRETKGLDLYQYEDGKIAYVYRELGYTDKAEQLIASYRAFMESDQSLYHDIIVAYDHAYMGNNEPAIEALTKFSEQKDIQFWVVLFMDQEPAFESLKNDPEFKAAVKRLEENFWQHHEEIKAQLSEKNLLIPERK